MNKAPANAEDTLQILQANEECFKAGVCKSLPCNCASELAALAAAPAAPPSDLAANYINDPTTVNANELTKALAAAPSENEFKPGPPDRFPRGSKENLAELAADTNRALKAEFENVPPAPPDDALARALDTVLATDRWPILKDYDDAGLTRHQYLEFLQEVFAALNALDAQKVGQDSSAMADRSVRSPTSPDFSLKRKST